MGTGCAVSEPDAHDWRSTSEQSLESAASAVGTTRLTLAHHAEGDLWKSYVVVVLREAEEATGTAGDDVSLLQPPPGMEKRATRVQELLTTAEDAVQAAREGAVAGDPVTPAQLRRLDRLRQRLMQEAGR